VVAITMGQELEQPSHFHKADYRRFQKALLAETELARQYCRCRFDHDSSTTTSSTRTTSTCAGCRGFDAKQPATVGMELGVFLVDTAQLQPACVANGLLEYLQTQRGTCTDTSAAADVADESKETKQKDDGSSVTHELGQFQLEYNSPVFTLTGNCLRQMQNDMQSFWDTAERAAVSQFDAHLLAVGILPTMRSEKLDLPSMSRRNRYRAINEQLLHDRHGRPVHLDIHCLPDIAAQVTSESPPSSLTLDHPNIMLEAMCCSFQLHWQIPCQQSARYFNAGLLVSPILVAVTANSPIVLGRVSSWHESRIPVFEQACAFQHERAWLGSGFVRECVLEVFEQNVDFPILLPARFSTNTTREEFRHLGLHNGSLWRWHRPLIGTTRTSNLVDAGDNVSETETAHLRMEHRTVPAGPTVVDSIANAAFYYGLVEELANQPVPPESMCTFETVRTNFYQAAELGLEAEIEWLCGEEPNPRTVQNLVLESLLPAARRGLERLKINTSDAEYYLGVIEWRVKMGQTGATWQRRWMEKHGQHDTQALTSAYHVRQQTGRPCSEWDV
jgi:gamma-glutamyl:cysteine ligase YbdK (ATP-grasp superfamily)